MPENEYLKLLSNRLFWGVIVFSATILLTTSGLYFGLKETMKDNRNAVIMEVREIKYRLSIDSLKQANRWSQQGNIDESQNDEINRLKGVR